MSRRLEGKASDICISSSRARPALFFPVAIEWQECTYVSFSSLLILSDSFVIHVKFLGRFINLSVILRMWLEFMRHYG
jgi:hypothetical protein